MPCGPIWTTNKYQPISESSTTGARATMKIAGPTSRDKISNQAKNATYITINGVRRKLMRSVSVSMKMLARQDSEKNALQNMYQFASMPFDLETQPKRGSEERGK